MTVLRGPWAGEGAPPARPERRGAARVRTLLGGRAFATDRTSVACTIHDLSEAGARLSVQPPSQAPASFHLMSPKTRSGHEAKVVWRTGTCVGVSFTRSYELGDPNPEFEVRLAWLRLNVS